MPCYHFDLRGEETVQAGVNLPGIEEARLEAVRLAGDLLSDAPEAFWRGEDWNLDVTNCDRKVLFTLSVTCRDGPAGVEAADLCPVDDAD